MAGNSVPTGSHVIKPRTLETLALGRREQRTLSDRLALAFRCAISAMSLHTVWVDLSVEVFPVSNSRWVAVIDAPLGEFSTESPTPGGVPEEVASSIVRVLGRNQSWHLVDELGRPWSPDVAPVQLRRMLGTDGT
jgi:hypothetical protein